MSLLHAEQNFLPHSKIPVSDALYSQLLEQAKQNVKALPSLPQKQYGKLLKDYPDALMAFLIGYEESSKLTEANPEDVLSNYESICDLLKSRDFDLKAEFFLSYVAKQSASDERIEAYRKALLNDGLAELMAKSSSELELYRELSHWCTARLLFRQTSGRDQSPMDIALRSLYGRCEEMQILFVAACRTVGLPARAASTPYWAHTDNNHAWAEVFLDGKWYYTGDMDGAYYPNQTWFSGMIDKTVLILADGTIPDPEEEVLVRGRYECVINSTPNYALERTRSCELSFVDVEGMPLADVPVSVMVYNWSSLRPIMNLVSDAEGKLIFSAGRGAFYLMAEKGNIRALTLIPSSEETFIAKQIVLGESILDQVAIMAYPENPMTWQQAPESYITASKAAKAKWEERSNGYERLLPLNQSDSLYIKVLNLCRNNSLSLQLFMDQLTAPQEQKRGFLNLLHNADPKFLWQANPRQFAALYDHYSRYAHSEAKLSSRVFMSLMSPTVHFEELSQAFGKKLPKLYPDFFIIKAKDNQDLLNKLHKSLSRRYKIDDAKALSGLIRLDVAAAQKNLNAYQFKILFCQALKANGIPAEYARIPYTINIWWDDTWQYYNVIENRFSQKTAASTKPLCQVQVQVLDEKSQPLAIAPDNLYLSFYQGGLFYPLNTQFTEQENASWEAKLESGEYYLQTGYRISNDKTFFRLDRLVIEPNDSLKTLQISTLEFPSRWKEIEPILKPIVSDASYDAYQYIVLGNHSQENTLRIADALTSRNHSFIILGYESSSTISHPYLVSEPWQKLCEDASIRIKSITLRKTAEGKWEMYEGLWYQLPE